MSKQFLVEKSDFNTNSFHSNTLLEGVGTRGLIVESEEATGVTIVKRVPCTILDKKNQNGRIYQTKDVKKAIQRCRDEKLFEKRQLLCQSCDHPQDNFVIPSSASHAVIDAYIENVSGIGNVFFNDWAIPNTSAGQDLKALIEANFSVGTSIRGFGDLKGDYVYDYEFFGTDVVAEPSSSTFTRTVESADSPNYQKWFWKILEYDDQDLREEIKELTQAISWSTEQGHSKKAIDTLYDKLYTANGLIFGSLSEKVIETLFYDGIITLLDSNRITDKESRASLEKELEKFIPVFPGSKLNGKKFSNKRDYAKEYKAMIIAGVKPDLEGKRFKWEKLLTDKDIEEINNPSKQLSFDFSKGSIVENKLTKSLGVVLESRDNKLLVKWVHSNQKGLVESSKLNKLGNKDI